MTGLFISYSRKDIDSARKLTEAFKDQELDFWIDWEGIPPTMDWWREIEKGIEEADIFLFLISPDSTKSIVCNREIEHAARNGKRLIPIVVRDILADESPNELSHLNWIFLREKDDFNSALSKLINAIKTDYEWVQTHRQLQVKALEWERTNKENSFLLRGKELQDGEFQLATNSSKEPHPTDLQREYVLKSRQATDRQRRITTSIAIAGVIALAALAVFGFVQAGLATSNEKKAVSNASTAQAASTLAFNNAATAVANEQEAKKQAQIALARQLAAQAQVLFTDKQQTAALLAVQSMRMLPSFEAAQILQTNTLAHPVAHMTHEGGTFSVAFSPDGKYIVSEGCDQMLDKNNCVSYSARVWEATTGEEIARMTHDDWVRSVAFSPDGKYIVSGSDDKTMRVWETATGKEIARMTHDDIVSSVGFSPDGMYVVSGSRDNTARVWDAFTGTEVARMTHDAEVVSVAFSPNGNYVVSEDGIIIPRYSMGGGGGSSNTVRVWVFNTGQEVVRMTYGGLMVSGDPMKSVAFSRDGRYIATGGQDFTAHVWEATTGQEVAHMTHGNRVTSVAFSPDGKYIVSGSDDKTARVWEVDTGQEIARMTHNDIVTSVAFSPDGNYVVSGSYDKSARVWEVTAKKEIARVMHDGNVVSVAFSPDGKYVVSGGGNTALVWTASTGQEIARMTHDGGVNSVTFSPDGNYVISGSWDNTARLWGALTGQEVSRLTFDFYSGNFAFANFSPDWKYIVLGTCEQRDNRENGLGLCLSGYARVLAVDSGKEITRMTYDGDVSSAAFSSDGMYIAFGSCDQQDNTQSCISGSARVRETATGKEVTRAMHDGRVFSVAFSPDGKYVLSGSWDNTIRVWEALTGKEVSRMIHDEVVWYSVAFSPDEKYVVSDGCDKINKNIICISGFIRVWETLTGKEVAHMAHDDWVRSVAFSPDGKYIVSGSMDKTVRIWEALTGKEVARMAHDDIVNSVAFSPDGKYVVSGSDDKTARLWDDATGQEIARMTHNDGVTSVAFSPDGKYVVSGGYDKTARVWMWRPEDLITNTCLHITRNLTVAEWQQYVGNTLPYTPACPDLTIENEAKPIPTAVTEGSIAPTATLTLTKTPTINLTPSVMVETLYQYTVQQGDTLISIAQKFNIPIEVIIQDNKLGDPNSLFVGQILVIRITATATVKPPP
jgi:uncharacterized delta-60 repeat protein